MRARQLRLARVDIVSVLNQSRCCLTETAGAVDVSKHCRADIVLVQCVARRQLTVCESARAWCVVPALVLLTCFVNVLRLSVQTSVSLPLREF